MWFSYRAWYNEEQLSQWQSNLVDDITLINDLNVLRLKLQNIRTGSVVEDVKGVC